MMPIECISLKAKYEMKLLDYQCTRSPSQRFTEKVQERFFVACLPTFFNNKLSLTLISLLCRIYISTGLKTSKYLFEIIPDKLRKVRSKINHTQHFRSISWQTDDADWVQQFIIRRRNETSGLQVHKISFTTLHRTNIGTVFSLPVFHLCLNVDIVVPRLKSEIKNII